MNGCSTYVERALTNDPSISFTCYTFSYRGYKPNDKDLGFCTEPANTQDALDFYEHVKAVHPNDKKIIIVSHSLGTGVASKVGQAEDSACVALGMPYASMLQVSNSRLEKED